ncbi:Methyltransferase domain-containing protein [Amycolatopsis arida]|uniref:Methyltransferase domain-containing protein n=1 Tax=Amycolatopsis arida TaxID=587909 RepID=A0A1I5SB33_9PSEU|nr:methyltransferase domain-containing protein [Amycolatopsis arida]TDX96537.1 methyltransferase family protein [Amycolatopsis arida]SFP67923.1 Methyltransferase domain-containing protein [Amycolatopsis arida]
MGARDRLAAGLARQLGHPSGLPGLLVGALLNRSNARPVAAAVRALRLAPGEEVTDIGYGGGAGLRLLLDAVGPAGRVHGVELSTTMSEQAHKRFWKALAAGRLRLHHGSITALPLDDDSVDALITINTVYFVADLDRAFAELARVLRASGRLVVGIGDPDAMAGMPFTEHGFRLRPVAELVDALTAAGLPLREHLRVGQGPRAFHLLVAAH